MQAQSNALRKTLFQCIASVVLLYVVFFPVVYVIVTVDIHDLMPVWLYLAVSILKLVLAICMGLLIRKKNAATLQSNSTQRRNISLVILGLLAAKGFLTLMGVPQYLYGSLTISLGMFDSEKIPVFLSLVWEQMFSSYLFFNILLCAAIVFFYKPRSLFCSTSKV